MKKFRIYILSLVGILLLGLILYHVPQKRQASMWVCSETGDTAWVEMNYKYYRRLFRNPAVKGTMTFNGVEYIDEETLLKTIPYVDDEGWDQTVWFPKETEDLPENMIFCIKSDAKLPMDAYWEGARNRIIFWDVSGGDSFEKMCFAYLDESNTDKTGSADGIFYYGPAQTVEEAQQIATNFGLKMPS